MEWNELLRVATLAARGAAQIHRQYVGRVRPDEWSSKGASDFVSHVDREAETCIIEQIHSAFPDHQIMAEEGFSDAALQTGAHWAEPEWLWLVDPLDGTTNFLHGYPVYAASVAVAHHGRLVAGVVNSSPTGEEWSALRGQGATRNGLPIQVSRIERLDTALVGTGFPFKNLDLMPGYLTQFDTVIRRTSGVRRAGSAALDLCHVASGYFDGFWELDLYPWDTAAGILMISEAGGLVTGIDGSEYRPFDRGGVLAGNPVIHHALHNLLHGLS